MLQSAPAGSQQLSIQNDTGNQTILRRADIETLPRVKVQTAAPGMLSQSSKTSHPDLCLEKAGIGLGETLKGK